MTARRSLPQDDPAESCYQVRLALAVPPGLEAGPQPVTGLDLGLVAGRHLGDGGVVLGGQGLQHATSGRSTAGVCSRQTSWASR